MDHRDAVDMLRNTPLQGSGPQRWADLGCGTGTFTCALAELLPQESVIHAMDRDAVALAQVPEQFDDVRIVKHAGDFVHDALPATELDGIFLANTLHFVRDQVGFIRKAATHLKPTGIFLLVEYDTDAPNHWVPHPLSFTTLTELFRAVGFWTVIRLAERPSAFRQARLYSVHVMRSSWVS